MYMQSKHKEHFGAIKFELTYLKLSKFEIPSLSNFSIK
jgi:hypothetical protein